MKKTGTFVLCAASLAFAACGQSSPSSTSTPEAAPAAAAKPAAPDPKVTAALADLPEAYHAADVDNGKTKFGLCRSCHTVVQDGPNMTGPNLYGVFGKAAGAKAGFAYSDALKAKGLTWDADTLDKWIASPKDLVPNTKMSFAGLKDATDRRDVIAYLKAASVGATN